MLDRMTRARAALIQGHPFFGTLAFNLKFADAPANVETFHLAGDRLLINPAWAEAQVDGSVLQGLLASTVLKPALGHPMRRGTRDERLWILSSHHVTNLIVTAAGMQIPQGAPCDPRFEGMTVEQVFSTLLAEQMPPEQDQEQDGEEGDAGSEGGAEGGSEGGSPNGGGDQPGEPGADDGEPGHVGDVGGCGSFEDQPGHDGDSASPAEMSQAEQDWKIRTVQAAAAARAAGQLSGDLAELVGQIKEPRVSWRDELRSFMTRATRSDHSWTRPDRRFAHQGLYLPSLHDPALDCVVWLQDTSGSVSTAELEAGQAEFNAVLEDLRPSRVIVIMCDTSIKDVREYGPDDYPVSLEFKGRGGTALHPAFAYLAENGIDPDVMICCSDLEFFGSFPAQPDCPVLWLSVDREHDPVPYGDVTYLDLSE